MRAVLAFGADQLGGGGVTALLAAIAGLAVESVRDLGHPLNGAIVAAHAERTLEP